MTPEVTPMSDPTTERYCPCNLTCHTESESPCSMDCWAHHGEVIGGAWPRGLPVSDALDPQAEHLRNHLTDGGWHDSCVYCKRRRRMGGNGVDEPKSRPGGNPQ